MNPNGVVFENGNTFIVYEIENKTKEDNYKNILKHLTQQYVSPKEVLSTYDNESITVNAVSEIVVGKTNYGGKLLKSLNEVVYGKLNYTITILVKDSKIRFNVPHVNSILFNHNEIFIKGNNFTAPAIANNVYNQKSKLTNEILKNSIENCFVNFIEDVVKSAKGIDKNEEW